jgi:hypothetical protein
MVLKTLNQCTVGQIFFVNVKKKSEFFFYGPYVHFQFRVLAKFNEESEFGEKQMKKKIGFWA